MKVIAAPEVMARLKLHRMHEMLSTGRPLDAFCHWLEVSGGDPQLLETEAGNLEITAQKSQHSEICFGAIVRHDEASIGWTGDSAFSEEVLDSITKDTQLAIVDARKLSSCEHASFAEIRHYVESKETLAFLGPRDAPFSEATCWLAIIGYGSSHEAPGQEDGIPESAVLRPGTRISFIDGQPVREL
eukprot:TRINITY_DN27523_c0_g1_i3.p2 TRINITY_DN27523_c0_g1~~TRINITY_DN27523_c0_g1_i3.p2  ORF type:complete len:187 (-),score=48.33 TRINITY_DN27523_c0_g1_i3:1056-1616(-)